IFNAVGWGALCVLVFVCGSLADEPVEKEITPDSAAAIVALAVEPAEIVLHAASRQQQLMVTGRRSDGKLVDLTRQAEFRLADAAVARIASTTIVGQHDGATDLTI